MSNIDFSHYDAICDRILRENGRLLLAKTQHEADFRKREIASAERELESERKFLGLPKVTMDDILSDDELLAELAA